MFLHADNKDSDQTGRMPKLILVVAGRTSHFVGFVMRRLILFPIYKFVAPYSSPASRFSSLFKTYLARCKKSVASRIRNITGKSNFAEQFRKLINRYKRIEYNPYIMRQTACLVVNPITVDSYALLF